MVPISLKLKNFLSYGEEVPPLDFREFHVVCLSGPNGHGKSALLDAITWALWGEARKAAGDRKPDESLVRLGATEMQVEFEFDLEGDRFRILRQYRRTKRGVSRLEFQMFDPAQGRYVPLTQPSLAETQAKINQFLRMDYPTFINSAFLLQGRADEFSRQSPRERKQILAEILGLSRYDELSELARDHARKAAQEVQSCEERLEQYAEELRLKEEYRRRLEEVETDLARWTETLAQAEARLEELRERRSELLQQRQRAADLEKVLAQLDRDLAELSAQAAAQQQEIAACEQVLAQRERIEAAVRRWAELQAQDRELNGQRALLEGYNERIHALDRAIEAARHELESQYRVAQTRWQQAQERLQEVEALLSRAAETEQGYAALQQARAEEERWEQRRREAEALDRQERELQRQIDRARNEVEVQLRTLAHRAGELRQRAAGLAQCEQQLAQARQALRRAEEAVRSRESLRDRESELTSQIGALKSQRDRLQEEIRETEEKQALLARSPEARCPLCDSHLGEGGLRAIRQRYAQMIQEHRQRIEAITDQARLLVKQRKELQAQRQALEDAPAQVAAAQGQIAALEAARQEAVQARREEAAVQQQIAALQQQWEAHAYAPEEVRRCQEVQQRRRELGYDEALSQKARQQVRQLQPYEVEYQRLQEARQRHERMLQALPEIEALVHQLGRQLEQGQYALEEQAERARLREQSQAVGYRPDLHRQVQEELQQLQEAPRQQERLAEAERRRAAALEAQQRTAAALADRRQRRQEAAAEQARWQSAAAALEEVEAALAAEEPRRRQARQQREALLAEHGRLQSQYQRCLALEEEVARLRPQLQQARRDADLYAKLATAFGKDGIQALIIENAIPEIEEEANQILRRLTHNRTQITIEPLRDLKSGGTRETLDLHISDELGTRSQELYSGGERFRIDFALRLALSKLLAQRAGTKLRTLVIDEGFGTQDADGLEQFVEVIGEISQDFDKVLVVTHLEALKNAFPVRIEVLKDPQRGSRFEVIG